LALLYSYTGRCFHTLPMGYHSQETAKWLVRPHRSVIAGGGELSSRLCNYRSVGISNETRKRLWGKSGNRCVICRHELIRRDAGSEPGALVGQEAHIVARSPGGARYASLPVKDRDGYDNLILLCANDHREVDTQPGRYTVERLRAMKREHELWVANRLDHAPPYDSGEALAHVMFTGDQVWDVVHGSLGYQYALPEDLTDDQADIVDSTVQQLIEWGEISEDVALQGLPKVREAKRSMQDRIDELASAGFLLLGGARVGPLAGGAITGRISVLHVVRPEDLAALKMDQPEDAREQPNSH
jgi:hypothetical protein